jgi:hypothetical protein
VRTLVVCDSVRTSKVEENVFHLRGTRYHIRAASFPMQRRPWLFLILSSPRPGRFSGDVKVIDDSTDRTIYYGRIEPPPRFPADGDLLPLVLPVTVGFPQAGRYIVQIWFFQENSADVLKMEQSFDVLEREA